MKGYSVYKEIKQLKELGLKKAQVAGNLPYPQRGLKPVGRKRKETSVVLHIIHFLTRKKIETQQDMRGKRYELQTT